MPDSKTGQVQVLIITGGNVNEQFLIDFINKNPHCIRICVDGGLRIAYDNQLELDYIVGDFDTIDKEIIRYYKEETEVPIREFNPVKDNTDTDIALELAISLKPMEIVIIGGMGSRMDHTLANIQILKKPMEAGIRAYLLDEHNRISMIDSNVIIDKQSQYGDYISLLPITQNIINLTLKGFKYPLQAAKMEYGESVGISNEIIDEKAEISFDSGILLMIEASD